MGSMNVVEDVTSTFAIKVLGGRGVGKEWKISKKLY